MLILKNKLTEALFFIVLAVGLSLFFLIQSDNRTNKRVFSQTPFNYESPIPTTIPPGYTQMQKIDSPDGNKTLIMKKQKISSFIDYSFFVLDKSNPDEERFIVRKKEEETQSLSIPYNAWSPNNLNFFIKETTLNVNNYYVFSVSGDYSSDSSLVNIQALFTEKVKDYILTDVTGWADPNLLIINAKTVKGERHSFWFDILSQSFMRLSTNFY